ncbi:MAG TPA: tetratricopeptide repeat protein [Trueperaceae bacterium]
MRAVELFYRAIDRGNEAARINLAHALAYIERGDEVIPELLKVDCESLSTYDKVLYYRVKSLHEETSGDLRTALSDAETAWQLVQTAPQFSILAPDILSQLAVLNGRVGQAKRALAFIEQNVAITSGVDAIRARIHRIQILIALGRFSHAIAELSSLQDSTVPRHLLAILRIHMAEAEWAFGRVSKSISLFEEALEIAANLDIGYEEFLARVCLAYLYGHEGNLDVAYEHLSNAERLVGDRSDRLTYRFREILLRRLSGAIGSVEAITELRNVESELEKMGARQEQGWIKLHVARELWLTGSNEYQVELRGIEQIATELMNPALLSRELPLVDDFAFVVFAESRSLSTSRGGLEVTSLGATELRLDGSPIHLPLTRGIEMICYFLENGSASLQQILSDLFPNYKPRSARSYFHQFRHQLTKSVEGISVDYDRDSGQYRLVSAIPIDWDVTRLRLGEEDLVGLSFLPNSSSPWVIKLNETLESARRTLNTSSGKKAPH